MKSSPRVGVLRRGSLAAVAAGLVGLLLAAPSGATPSALPAPAVVLSNSVPGLVHEATVLGTMPVNRVLNLVAPLELPSRTALNDYVQAEYTPSSPDFHSFLTPQAFGERFGAPLGEVDDADGALRALGFKVTAPAPNRLFLDFSGTVGLIEQVFGTTLDNVALSTGLTAYSNISPIVIPSSLSGLISDVIGLNSFSHAQSQMVRSTVRVPLPAAVQSEVGIDGGATPCPQAVAGAGYTAPNLAEAYGFNGLYAQGLLGQGMSSALLEFDDYHDSNVASVEQCYGETTPVSRVLVDGGTGAPPGAGEGEDMLDLSVMLEMLPKLAHLYVYVAPNTSPGELDVYSEFANNDNASVISSSWSSCEEASSQGYDQLFNTLTEQAAAEGLQIFQDTQDTGAVGCRGYPAPYGGSISVQQEDGSPWVTSIGGTNLGISSVLGDHAEVTWNDEFGAGGGGQSAYYTMPWYQTLVPSVLTAPGADGAVCGAPKGELCREVPDLSANADILTGLLGRETHPNLVDGSPGYAMYCNTPNCGFLSSELDEPVPDLPDQLLGWQPNGGTSAATPLTAAAGILWDEEAQKAGLTSVGFINPLLYEVAANPVKYASDFYDITTDSNDPIYDSSACPTGCDVNHLYAAQPGYDMASGLGSYNASNLGADLVTEAAQTVLTPSLVTLYGYTKGVATTTPVTVTSGHDASPFTATSNASWLHVTSGKLDSTLQFSADPDGLAPGTYSGQISINSVGGPATLTVHYLVTPPAKLVVSPTSLHFSERPINKDNQTVTPTCNDTLWNDEFAGALEDTTIPVDASTRRPLYIANEGAKGSVLHWSVTFASEMDDWLNPDLELGESLRQVGGPPFVSTGGSLYAGKVPDVVAFASIADGDTPELNQGTYHGLVDVTDLADPQIHVSVPVTMVLGNGKDTPTVVAAPQSLHVSLPPNATQHVTIKLSDGSNDCGFVYSATTTVPWANVSNDNDYSGTVAATGTSAPSSTGNGSGTGTIPITIDTQSMAAGTYHGEVIVQSLDAEPNPTMVPITITVT